LPLAGAVWSAGEQNVNAELGPWLGAKERKFRVTKVPVTPDKLFSGCPLASHPDDRWVDQIEEALKGPSPSDCVDLYYGYCHRRKRKCPECLEKLNGEARVQAIWMGFLLWAFGEYCVDSWIEIHDHSASPMPDSSQKPDIVVKIRPEYQVRGGRWPDVVFVIELKASLEKHRLEALQQAVDRAKAIFEGQPYRESVISVLASEKEVIFTKITRGPIRAGARMYEVQVTGRLPFNIQDPQNEAFGYIRRILRSPPRACGFVHWPDHMEYYNIGNLQLQYSEVTLQNKDVIVYTATESGPMDDTTIRPSAESLSAEVSSKNQVDQAGSDIRERRYVIFCKDLGYQKKLVS
jgi:hypothetical protein